MRNLTVLIACGHGQLLLLVGTREGVLLLGVVLLGEALGVLPSLLLRLGKGRILWLGFQLLIHSARLGAPVAALGEQARRVLLGLVLLLLLVLRRKAGGGGMLTMMSLRRTRR